MSDSPRPPASPESTKENEYDSPRNWVEDFGYENGQYVNRCTECRKTFVGHKRRRICKVCASPESVPETPQVIRDGSAPSNVAPQGHYAGGRGRAEPE